MRCVSKYRDRTSRSPLSLSNTCLLQLSMNRCNDVVWKMVRKIAEESHIDIHDVGWADGHDLANYSSEETHGRTFFPEGPLQNRIIDDEKKCDALVRRTSSEHITLPCEMPILLGLENRPHPSEPATDPRSVVSVDHGSHDSSSVLISVMRVVLDGVIPKTWSTGCLVIIRIPRTGCVASWQC